MINGSQKWDDFCISDFFDIHPTKAYKDTNAKLFNGGDNPVVVNSAYNNGIGGYSTYENTEKGKIITFSDTVDANTIFYQENDFIGYPHVQGMYPIGKYADFWNKDRFLFFISVFRKTAFVKGFNYGNKFRRDIAINLIIKLPVDNDGNPDWQYMDDYMRGIETKVKADIKFLQQQSIAKKHNINLAKFKRFNLYDKNLFRIDSGTKLDKVYMSELNPSINFVGRANANNGVTCYIDKIDGIEPYKAGCLTVSLGGEYLGSCFIQDQDFYTSQNVNVLIPTHPMSFYVKKYISIMVFQEGRVHYKAFIDELNRHIKTDFTIPLPVDSKGDPDWDYMENYMRGIERIAQNNLTALNSVVAE